MPACRRQELGRLAEAVLAVLWAVVVIAAALVLDVAQALQELGRLAEGGHGSVCAGRPTIWSGPTM